jgi:hypothetical protein
MSRGSIRGDRRAPAAGIDGGTAAGIAAGGSSARLASRLALAAALNAARSGPDRRSASASIRTVADLGCCATPRSRSLIVRAAIPEASARSSCDHAMLWRWRLSATPKMFAAVESPPVR